MVIPASRQLRRRLSFAGRQVYIPALLYRNSRIADEVLALAGPTGQLLRREGIGGDQPLASTGSRSKFNLSRIYFKG
ncbi:MAG: hypothetical protein IIB43_05715 [Candidatus Marinimicrobia bacterium]|nr:hypothetical protein [Candidatus Neomarinimicrobiota bacterium]